MGEECVVTTVGINFLLLVVIAAVCGHTSSRRAATGDSFDDEAVRQLLAQEGQELGGGAGAVGELELLELSQLRKPGQATSRNLRAACMEGDKKERDCRDYSGGQLAPV